MRQPEIGGQFLECSRQYDSLSVGAHVDGEKMPNAVARGMDVAPFKTCPQRYLYVRFFRPVPAALIRYQVGAWYHQTWCYGAPLGGDGEGYRSLVRDMGGEGKLS